MEKINKPYTWYPGLLFLHTGLRDEPNCWNTVAQFKRYYDENWFNDSWNVEVVKDIDNSNMIVPGVFRSPVLGNINHLQISGGAKCLILLNEMPECIMSLSSMGHNCAEKLYELTLRKEIHLFHDGYVMDFVKDQKILDVESGILFTTEERWDWLAKYAITDPDILFPVKE